jgi:hypothetical protein
VARRRLLSWARDAPGAIAPRTRATSQLVQLRQRAMAQNVTLLRRPALLGTLVTGRIPARAKSRSNSEAELDASGPLLAAGSPTSGSRRVDENRRSGAQGFVASRYRLMDLARGSPHEVHRERLSVDTNARRVVAAAAQAVTRKACQQLSMALGLAKFSHRPRVAPWG